MDFIRFFFFFFRCVCELCVEEKTTKRALGFARFSSASFSTWWAPNGRGEVVRRRSTGCVARRNRPLPTPYYSSPVIFWLLFLINQEWLFLFNRRLSQPIKPFDRAGAVDRNTIQRPFVDESCTPDCVSSLFVRLFPSIPAVYYAMSHCCFVVFFGTPIDPDRERTGTETQTRSTKSRAYLVWPHWINQGDSHWSDKNHSNESNK